MILAQHK